MLDQSDTRAVRHEATRERILKAAWKLARKEGLTSFSLRDLAKAVGMRAPSLYSYFASKNDLYDAMFGQAAAEMLTLAPVDPDPDFETAIRERGRRFLRWSTADQARYQLLFQRTIPDFEPSPESFAPSVESMRRMREIFDRGGVHERWIDMYTAILSGLAAQQLANDPGGDRWERLLDDAMEMFLRHVRDDKRRGKR